MGLCKAFMLAGIKNLLERNYKVDTDKLDLEAEIDDSLTFSENWNNIKKKGRGLMPPV